MYNFDSELRSLLFTAIEKIEIAFRTQIIFRYSMAYGAYWFADKELFKEENIYNKDVTQIHSEISRSKEVFIVNHKNKYDEADELPSWKSLEVCSFGLLSSMFLI